MQQLEDFAYLLLSYDCAMADDRYTFIHASDLAVQRLGTDDEDFLVDLPNEDIDVPAHLMPRYQDEEEESKLLPTEKHPSYPFGNPYALDMGISADPFTAFRSLATNLPALTLPRGVPVRNLQWTDLGLNQLLAVHETRVVEEVTNASAADQVAREGEEAQHRAANASDSDEAESDSVQSTPPAAAPAAPSDTEA